MISHLHPNFKWLLFKKDHYGLYTALRIMPNIYDSPAVGLAPNSLFIVQQIFADNMPIASEVCNLRDIF